MFDFCFPAPGKSIQDIINYQISRSIRYRCDFDYAGRMIETLMLGFAAHQAGKVLNYNHAEGRATNDAIANDYLRKEYRTGWVLNG